MQVNITHFRNADDQIFYKNANLGLVAATKPLASHRWDPWQSNQSYANEIRLTAAAGSTVPCYLPPLMLDYPPGGDIGLIYLDGGASPQIEMISLAAWYGVGGTFLFLALVLGIFLGFLVYKDEQRMRKKLERELAQMESLVHTRSSYSMSSMSSETRKRTE
eukprot:TRINITY_DN2095_c0_g1_i2.p1 TRINITY_DN2095_c0_g1~~TRINITY_DN2095_c0_g1_i2.p1  ORF type:complete len:162 (-),score=22.41 TRINITY_DN2095_c0_g1_i2:37-522(-)